MRLSLVGTGRMGTAVGELAADRGHEIVGRYDSENPLPEERAAVSTAEVLIDFSLPHLAVEHIDRYCRWGIPAVIGTTGWYDRLDEVRRMAENEDAAILYAPNFSVGIALVVRALRSVLPMLDQIPEYDAYVHEVHHVNKVDSPSGTAEMLGRLLVDGLARKSRIEPETQHGRIDADALHVTSTRAGGIIGKHTIALDSPFDEISIIHAAKSRAAFAYGAVRAAEWLKGRSGLFTLDDMLGWMTASR